MQESEEQPIYEFSINVTKKVTQHQVHFMFWVCTLLWILSVKNEPKRKKKQNKT